MGERRVRNAKVRGSIPLGSTNFFQLILEFSLFRLGPAAFYLKSVAPPDITLGIIFKSLAPFICIQITAVALLIAFPGITGH